MTEVTTLISELDAIRQRALEALKEVKDESGLQAWKTMHLGRNSPVMQIFTRLGEVPKEERPVIGQRSNQVKQDLEAELAFANENIRKAALELNLANERLDVTLPGRLPAVGRLHPATQTLRRIYDIFAEMGFQVYRSRDVETDEYNFELLNIPAYHPARDMWDTFHMTTPGVV
ncbi:MAG: phenylalanine--tRNA ligase subunit alpha, partial [Leptolinea sp.]